MNSTSKSKNNLDQNNETIATIIAGGLFGAFVGKLLTDDDEGALLLGVLGALVAASQRSKEVGKNNNIPILIARDQKLYKLYPDGSEEFIKDLPKAKKEWAQQFELT